MTKLAGLLIASLFTASAWAGSPFLAISETNTFASAERIAVEAAIAQGEAEGKPVLIDIAAAWCGPCLALETELANRKAEFDPLLAQFVNIEVEEMHFEWIAGTDFLAFDIAWFPSYMIYNPATGKWTALAATSADALKIVLNEYLTNPSLADLYTERLLAQVRGTGVVTLGALLDALIPLSVEADAARYFAVWGEISALMDSAPQRFEAPVDQIRDYLNMAHNRLMERGLATVADFRAVDAKLYAGLEANVGMLQYVEFQIPLGALIRTQGNVAAADQCGVLSAKVADLVGSATAEEQRYLQLAREAQCMLIDIQTKRKGATEALAWWSTLAEPERRGMAESLMKIFAAAGEWTMAIEYGTILQEAYLKAFASRPELLARVTAATNARLDAYRANKTHP